jgi:acylphosphatase
MTQLTAYRRYVVKGRVQGVGFRWFVEREAQLLAVGGWVRNCDDGSVEVLVMGTHQQHSALYDRLPPRRPRGWHRGGRNCSLYRLQDIPN